MSDYVPTTDEVRRQWAGSVDEYGTWDGQALTAGDAEVAFDAWLAAHDREVAARAWDEGVECAFQSVIIRKGRSDTLRLNPYRIDEKGQGR